MMTRVHHAPYPDEISNRESSHFRTNPGNSADDLMTRHAWIDSILPFILDLVDVRMAYTAKHDCDIDVVAGRLPPFNRHCSKFTVRMLGGVPDNLAHQSFSEAEIAAEGHIAHDILWAT
jgi:hypothetical protein